METSNRRHWLACTLSMGSAIAFSVSPWRAAAEAQAQVVALTARRFSYTPAEFKVRAGRPVTLEFTALDFVHGFNMPDLHLRVDLLPGRVTRVSLPPTEPGVYDFLCDNFCGDGHETMHGRMVVEP